MQALLNYLATLPENGRFPPYQITLIGGSANNKLYRVRHGSKAWAVKFTIRDARRRAWREFQALRVCGGLGLAPRPVLCDETSFAQPVVVQRWEEGVVTAAPPQTEAEWEWLLAHYVAIHQVTPNSTEIEVETAVHNFNGTASALAAIETQLTAVPPPHQPAHVHTFLAKLTTLPSLAPAAIALCRVDPNTLNFVRRDQGWLSVDWENSGWGDPAFELADLMAHPKYLGVENGRLAWLAARYAAQMGNRAAAERIYHYYPFMLVWWLARLARMLYEVPRGLDQRLAPRQPGWEMHLHRLCHQYEALARQHLAT